MHAKSFSHVQLFVNLWTVAHQAPLLMGFSRKEYWNGLPCPSSGDLPNPGVKPASLMSPALAGGFFSKQIQVEWDHSNWATWSWQPFLTHTHRWWSMQPYTQNLIYSCSQHPTCLYSWSLKLCWALQWLSFFPLEPALYDWKKRLIIQIHRHQCKATRWRIRETWQYQRNKINSNNQSERNRDLWIA